MDWGGEQGKLCAGRGDPDGSSQVPQESLPTWHGLLQVQVALSRLCSADREDRGGRDEAARQGLLWAPPVRWSPSLGASCLPCLPPAPLNVSLLSLRSSLCVPGEGLAGLVCGSQWQSPLGTGRPVPILPAPRFAEDGGAITSHRGASASPFSGGVGARCSFLLVFSPKPTETAGRAAAGRSLAVHQVPLPLSREGQVVVPRPPSGVSTEPHPQTPFGKGSLPK